MATKNLVKLPLCQDLLAALANREFGLFQKIWVGRTHSLLAVFRSLSHWEPNTHIYCFGLCDCSLDC